MEAPNGVNGGSKHPEWNNHSLTTRSNNEQSELAEEELSTVKKHEKIHVMLVNVGQCWSMGFQNVVPLHRRRKSPVSRPSALRNYSAISLSRP
jgi:hypothetical protein